MSAKYPVNLTQEEHCQLLDLTKKVKILLVFSLRAQILLLANEEYQSGCDHGHVNGRRINSQ